MTEKNKLQIEEMLLNPFSIRKAKIKLLGSLARKAKINFKQSVSYVYPWEPSYKRMFGDEELGLRQSKYLYLPLIAANTDSKIKVLFVPSDSYNSLYWNSNVTFIAVNIGEPELISLAKEVGLEVKESKYLEHARANVGKNYISYEVSF